MPSTPRSRGAAQVTPLPENEADFLRILRAHAFSSLDLRSGASAAGLTQLELEQQTAMSRPSILNLVKHLHPVLAELPGEGARGGRIALDPGAGVALGVDIGHAHVAVGAGDLYGRPSPPADPTAYERAGAAGIQDADATLDWVAAAVGRRLAELGREPSDVVGVGIAIAGPVDRARGVVRAALFPADPASTSDWELLGVREQLRRRLGWDDVPFLIDNDANLSALAEHAWGAARSRDGRQYRNVVYVEWSDGIGAGLILGGGLYRGAGAAGELGHAVVQDDGPVCRGCGATGCLESLAAWDALSREIPEAGDLEAALRLARSGDATARAVFERAADRLARGLGPLINVLNPDLVLIGGMVGRNGYEVIRPALLRGLKRHTMRPALQDVEVAGATLPGRAALQGALGLVLRTPEGDPDALIPYLQAKAGRARSATP
jgi:predicted NBD/HSP70 family sugar kinase